MSKRRTRPTTVAKPVTEIRPAHVVVFKGQGSQPWRFKIVGGNGETVAISEGYLTKWNANRAAKKLNLPFGDDD